MTPNVRVPLGVSTLPRRHALLMTGDYIVTNSDELSSGSHVTLHFASHGLKPGSQSCPARARKYPSDHAATGPYRAQPPRTTTRTRRANVSTTGGLMTRAVDGNVDNTPLNQIRGEPTARFQNAGRGSIRRSSRTSARSVSTKTATQRSEGR